MKPYIIIPARNEARTIASVIEPACAFGHVVVVDDGSSDGTSEVAEKSGAMVLQHIVNLGKGSALKTGCDFAVQEGAEKMVVIDADAQHDPLQIPQFLDLLKNNDVVFGYRTFSREMPSILRFGNRFINGTVAYLYGIHLNDTQCGYRAFTADSYKRLRWAATDYSVESEMVSRTGRAQLRYAQVPIKTVYLDSYKGTTVLDGIKIVLKMLWWRVHS